MFKVLFLSKIYPACHLDVNGIKPGSNSIMTDKHTTEHSKTASLGIYWPVCDVIVRLSLLRKTILNPEYYVFMCVCVFVDGCISQFLL